MTTSTITITLPLKTMIEIELMLLRASDALKSESRSMDRLGLHGIAESERQRAAEAQVLSAIVNTAICGSYSTITPVQEPHA